MFKKIILFGLFFIVITSINVQSASLYKHAYSNYQTIDSFREHVRVGKDSLSVEFSARIKVNYLIHNKSDWVSFTFSPTSLRYYENIESYKSSVNLQIPSSLRNKNFTSKTIFNEDFDNYSQYNYNVTINPLIDNNVIIFNANYTLSGSVHKIRDYEYTFYHVNDIESLNPTLFFQFPNNFEVFRVVAEGSWKPGPNYQIYWVDSKSTEKVMYFVFRDNDEKKQLELKEKQEERRFNIVLSIIFTLFGIYLGGKIFNKNKKILGNIEVKEFKKFQKAVIKIFKK